MHQGALVAFGLLPTSSRAFSVLEALHRRSEFEFGPDVVFEQENDFTHYRFENGASRILILSCKNTSAEIRCARRPQQKRNNRM